MKHQHQMIARCAAATFALVAISAMSSAQQKGLFFVNETTGNARSGEVLRWGMTAGGAFDGETVYDYTVGDMGAGAFCIGAGDFNGDGWTDAVWSVADNKLVIVYQQSGASTGSAEIDRELDAGWTSIDVGDFNGDGVADILVHNPNLNAHVWLMGGDEGNEVQEVIVLDKTKKNGTDRFIGFTDVDGDGMADILIQRTKKRVQYWKSTGSDVERDMNGKPVQNALTTLQKKIGKYNNTRIIGTLDVNGDGNADLVCRFLNPSGKYSVYVLFDDGTFTYPTGMQSHYRNAGFKTPMGVGGF